MTLKLPILVAVTLAGCAPAALAQSIIDPNHKYAWTENCGWTNWADADMGQGVLVAPTYLSGSVWGENGGWSSVGQVPADGVAYANVDGSDYGVNIDGAGNLSGFAWGENIGWINFGGGAMASPPAPARLDLGAMRFFGYAWGENIGWVNLDDATHYVGTVSTCGSADYDCDGDIGTDADIEAFFACLGGTCPPPPCTSSADFDGDGDIGTDADIEAFFRVLGGGTC
jgi:hypothetical protein